MADQPAQKKHGRKFRRRSALKLLGGIGGVSLAGCTGSEGGGGGGDGGSETLEFRWCHSTGPPERHAWAHDSLSPWGIWRLADMLDERSDGELQLKTIGEGQICHDGNSVGKINEGVVKMGGASLENSSGFVPANAVWTIPYTFPGDDPLDPSIPYTHMAEETWKRYWVPLAKEQGILPLYFPIQQPRQLYMAEEETITHPDQIEGMTFRRTLAETARITFEQWGGNPIEVEFSNIVSGMREGMLDGYTVSVPPAVSFGIMEETDQIIQTSQAGQADVTWVDVEWLKSLSDDHLEILANVTKELQQYHINNYPDILRNEIGFTDPPGEDTFLGERDVKVTSLSSDELQEWKNPLLQNKNPDLYDDIIQEAKGLADEDIYEYIFDKARESGVPDNYEDYEVESWWDEHIETI